MQAYSEDYLFDAMEALGEAFDCAANRVNLGDVYKRQAWITARWRPMAARSAAR